MATEHIVMARWTGVNYIVLDTDTGETWISDDGNEWRDENGEPIDTEEFDSATILLDGGPRDGAKVS